MKKFIAFMLVAMLLVVFCCSCLAETAAMPTAPMFTVNVTQLVIAVMGVIFNVLLAWLIKAVIPPLKNWLKEHTTTEMQTRAWTMIKWLVEAAEQTITGSAMGKERLEWVLAELRARGIEADMTMIEAAVKEMKDNAYKEIKHVIETDDAAKECIDCVVSLDDGK